MSVNVLGRQFDDSDYQAAKALETRMKMTTFFTII